MSVRAGCQIPGGEPGIERGLARALAAGRNQPLLGSRSAEHTNLPAIRLDGQAFAHEGDRIGAPFGELGEHALEHHIAGFDLLEQRGVTAGQA